MAEKTGYTYYADPQQVDFTLRMTVPALANEVLNTAGVDAQRKGFGIDKLNKENRSWVLSRMAIEIDDRPEQYSSYEIVTWVNEYNRMLSTRNFTLHDAAGREFGRAVTQWCIIDLGARKAIDLNTVIGTCADSIVDAPSPTEKPRKVTGIVPAAYCRTPGGLQRHRLQPSRQYDALYQHDVRYAAHRAADRDPPGAS